LGGFTLIELLIAMSIFLLILLGIYQMFDTNRATYVSGMRKVDVQQNARVALDAITRELRMAGYYPEQFDTDLTNDMPNAVAIQVGTASSLVLLGDVDNSGASNVFLYCLSGTTVVRLKSSQSGSGKGKPASNVAAAYGCSGGDVLAENITMLQFTYYDGSNNPVPNPPTVPYVLDGQTLNNVPAFDVNPPIPDVRTTIRTIVVTLVASESVPIPGLQAQRFTLTSSVRLRNINN
jgi:type IV pilus assembly protein PilW